MVVLEKNLPAVFSFNSSSDNFNNKWLQAINTGDLLLLSVKFCYL